MNEMVKTIYGWGIVNGEIDFIDNSYLNITLIENSFAPGKTIIAYPKDRILEKDTYE